MHGIGAGLRRGVQDPLDVQITVAWRTRTDRVRAVRQAHVERRAIALRIDGDGRDGHVAAGADHAHRDLAAVGDQNFLQRPYFTVSGVEAWLTALSGGASP